MSRCFDIKCHDCREKLWVGQRDYIYTTKEALSDLNEFLFRHENHSLTFEYDMDNEVYSKFERERE